MLHAKLRANDMLTHGCAGTLRQRSEAAVAHSTWPLNQTAYYYHSCVAMRSSIASTAAAQDMPTLHHRMVKGRLGTALLLKRQALNAVLRRPQLSHWQLAQAKSCKTGVQ